MPETVVTAKVPPFVETFKFVEEKSREKLPVPDHLLESKIYAKIQQNADVKATPSVVHFQGFEVGKTQRIVISLCNVAREVVRMHIIPPQSKYFMIKYTKGDRLVPGMTMSCTVEFTPDEHRYYYDCIRIHCPNEDNLVIPIHGYPTLDVSEFPAQLKFPLTALGQTRSHTFSLKCKVPVEFEYQIVKIQDSEAFIITPLKGIICENSESSVQIMYKPIAYCTSSMIIELHTSQFDFKPLRCSIMGYCQPANNPKMITDSQIVLSKREPRVQSPLDRSRHKKALNKSNTMADQMKKTKKVVEVEGLRFPDKIETVHHVSTVLIQTPGKMQLKELIEAEKSSSGRQMKETRFEMAIRKNVYEERQNQLRWQRRLGDKVMSSQDRSRAILEREFALSQYKMLRGEPVINEEMNRKGTVSTWRRTIRDAENLASAGIQFDLYSNNPWASKHSATSRFAQIARKIILRNRAKKNLSQLHSFLQKWSKNQEGDALSGKNGKQVPVLEAEDISNNAQLAHKPEFNPNLVTHVKYPVFVPPNKKDELAPDALNEVITYETDVEITTKIPYFNLQVPAQFKLLSYNEHEVHLGYDYVEPSLARGLRSGAQEEIINLQKPHEAVALATEVFAKPRGGEDEELRVEVVEKHDLEFPSSAVVSLRPPEAMFKPIDYPPLHIFNATPGLQVFETPVPYSEVDADYHLCPLPKYIILSDEHNPLKSTQKQYIDREDVIKGTMAWKKFPSQGLTSLASAATLTSVWVPRWTDPFNSNLMPDEVPDLQTGLSQEDELEYEGDYEHLDVQLTPEMVSAQFESLQTKRQPTEDKVTAVSENFPHGNKLPTTNLPVSSSGPIQREQREQELDYFLSKRSNRLGQKIQNKQQQLNSITYKNDLLLK